MDNSRPFATPLEDLVESATERRKKRMRAVTKKAAGKAIARRNSRKQIVAKAIEQKRASRLVSESQKRTVKKSLLGKRKMILPALFGVAVLCVLGIVAMRMFGGKKLSADVADIYRNDALIAVKKDGAYGFIDLNGKMVIAPKYSYAQDFHGDFAMVNGGTEGSDLYQVIDRKQKAVKQADFASDIVFDINSGYWSIEGAYYDAKMNALEERPRARETSATPAGYTISICDMGVGLMEDSRVAVACQWEQIDFFGSELRAYLESKGKRLVYAKRNERTAIIDIANGETMVDFTGGLKADRYSTFVQIQNGGSTTIYNLLTGKTVTVTAQAINPQPLYVRVDFADHSDFYNKDMKKIFTQEN